jgi:uncharacterized phage protein (TIGR02220 family)
MPIYKKKLLDKCIMLGNKTLQRKDMSLEAKGLLAYLLSLPEDWEFSINGIASQTNCNSKKIIKVLHELESLGYHRKEQYRENGRIKDWIYYIYAEPQQTIIDNYNEKQDCTKQQCRKQDCCFKGDIQTISNKLDIENNKTKEKEYIVELQNISNTDLTKKQKEDKILKENIKCIIDYLNESIKSNYRYTTKGTVNLIKARFKEGFTLDNFYDVIDKKVKEWYGTDMEKYLRPETLFGNKFEGYLNTKNTFKGTAKTSYSSKPSFDNTKDHNVCNDYVTDEEFDKMTFEEKRKLLSTKIPKCHHTPKQREFFNQYCLARDENGNLIKF